MYKKIIFVTLVGLLIRNSGFASLNPSFFAGFNGNFNYGEIGYLNKNTGYSFEFKPILGSIIWKNIAVGVSLDLGKIHYTGSTNFDFNEFGLGPFCRYYIYLKERHALFPSFSYSTGKSESASNTLIYDSNFNVIGNASAEITGNYNEFSPGLGYTFFITKNLAVEAVYSYNIRTEDLQTHILEVTNSGTFESTLNQNTSRHYHRLNIGFLFYLKLKKE